MNDVMSATQCVELFDIVCAFTSNMERTEVFARMPVQMAAMARRDQFVFDKVTVAAGHELNSRQLISGERPPLGDQGNAEYRKLLLDITPDQKEQIVRAGIKYVELLADVGVPPVVTSLDALFASVILESWTAFEILASDVWVEIVNHSPGSVRARINGSASTNKRTPKQETDVQPEIDPVENYGGAMIESDRVHFQTLRDIKEYYRLAISKEETNRIFKNTANGYLKALSAVRNLLTHKSGSVDSKFKAEVQHYPELNGYTEDQKLLLDGELVAKLRMAAITCGTELLKKADSIISPKTSSP